MGVETDMAAEDVVSSLDDRPELLKFQPSNHVDAKILRCQNRAAGDLPAAKAGLMAFTLR